MATEQYEKTPVNNVQARMRAVADTPDGSDVEIASEDREARDGREYRSNMTNKTAVKDIDEQHLSSEDEEEREEQGDSYKDSQMRAHIMYSEVIIEQLEILIAYQKEIMESNNHNKKLLQNMLNQIAESKFDVPFEKLSVNEYCPTRDLFHRCQQDRNRISKKGTAKKMSFVMMNVSDVYGSNDDGDDGDDTTNETPGGSAGTIRKDASVVKPTKRLPMQDSNINPRRSKH
ncbi:hypothetical protein E3Q06_00150 [Wallemia mellicola]|nr:hypothetical protein E3Q24_02285 [Wallemia mellicola]TIB91024.1 hypothetical protein E3Q21_00150 [Wallemia mellicola]TIB92688.1 hypothetical protein E3Q20_00150 [Wallemia mellicola]TIC38185.1 hypothetical protein E3Q09_00293 [Wallemia mellicola]TIC44414.1 hypothetical protein E3Q07_00150 [Wallemia mellicola]